MQIILEVACRLSFPDRSKVTNMLGIFSISYIKIMSVHHHASYYSKLKIRLLFKLKDFMVTEKRENHGSQVFIYGSRKRNCDSTSTFEPLQLDMKYKPDIVLQLYGKLIYSFLYVICIIPS